MITVLAHDPDTGLPVEVKQATMTVVATAFAALYEQFGYAVTVVEEQATPVTDKLVYHNNQDGSRDVYVPDHEFDAQYLHGQYLRPIGRLMPTSDAPQKPRNQAMQLTQARAAKGSNT